MEPIVFRAVRDIPELGIAAGDDVVFNPRAPRLFTLCKRIDPGAVLLSYESGDLSPLGPAPLPSDLARAAGYGGAADRPSLPPRDERTPSLRLER